MQKVRFAEHKMLAPLAAIVLSCALMLGVTVQAYASTDVPTYNAKCKISAVADNDQAANLPATSGSATATAAESGQHIDVTLTFPDGAPSVSASEAETYLQNHIVIARRHINDSDFGDPNPYSAQSGATYAHYLRDVDNVVVGANAITFTIEHNSYNSTIKTANFNGVLKLEADSTASSAFAAAMNGNDAETVIQSGLTLSLNSATTAEAEFEVDGPILNRGMVHVVFFNGNTQLFTASYNGVVTFHAHDFAILQPATIASRIADAANAAATACGSTLEFDASVGDGTFTVLDSGDNGDCSSIRAYVYDGAYLNSRSEAAANITALEPYTNN